MASRWSRPSGRKPRLLVLALIIMIGMIPSAGVMALQGTGDHQLPVEMETDLPAMALYPYDFGIDGLVTIQSTLMGVSAYAQFLADANGEDPAAIADTLEDEEFHAHYATWSGIPSSTSSVGVGIGVITMIAEYDNEDGAEVGYDLAVSWITGTEEVDAPVIGEQSTLVRTDMSDATDEAPVVQLDYAFQVENYVGILTIAWFEDEIDNEYDADEMATVVEDIVDRIEEGADDDLAGLSLPILRLGATNDVALEWHEEMYDLLEGNYAMTSYHDADSAESSMIFLEESGVEDYYRVNTGFLLPDGTSGVFTNRVFDLGRSRTASDWIDDSVAFFMEEDDPAAYGGYGEPTELDGFDADVVGVTYSYAGESDGMRVWFQVDGIVYSVEADGPNGIDEDVFFELVEQQIECAEDEAYCEPVAVPDELFL